jgi:hypothetical protein
MASKTNASWSQLKQSGTNTGLTLSGSSKMEKSLNTKDACQETSPLDTLFQLAQISHLCPRLGDTLVCFLHATPKRAPYILRLASRIVAEALITNDQLEGPNETLCNLGPIAHLIPLPGCLLVDQKPIPLSSLMMMK